MNQRGEALLRVQDGVWLWFQHPCAVVQAYTPAEVSAALQRVEEFCQQGFYAVGGLSYEAAAAFDAHLHVCPSRDLLLWFAIYSSAQEVTATDRNACSPSADCPEFYALESAESYHAAFSEVQQRITAGDAYQINYAFPLRAAQSLDLRRFFLDRLVPQSSGYLFYQDIGVLQIASVSPELFFERRGDHIRTRPMKGTRPRAQDRRQDQALRADLASSPKDRAENLMIVDMMRNDLGRIAQTGSVQVDTLLEIEEYPTVWQMVSEVSARSSASLSALFSALFPCASVTGAPKDAAMKTIATLEAQPRGFYTGALGYIEPGGDARFSVAIRTLTQKKGQPPVYRVGSGLVADSRSAEEYAECLHKARVLGTVHAGMQLLETILQLPDGHFWLAAGHLRRLRNSCARLGLRWERASLRRELQTLEPTGQFARIRLLCAVDGKITVQRDFLPADPRLAGAPWKVEVVPRPEEWGRSSLRFCHKTTLRTHFEQLLQRFPHRDDLLLYDADGYLCESCKANIVLEDAEGFWTPPAAQPLLPGVLRQHLLRSGALQERPIHHNELATAKNIWLINSLRGWISVTIARHFF